MSRIENEQLICLQWSRENAVCRLIRNFFKGLKVALSFAPTLQTFRRPQI
jgi:hypothetical protein